jgi:hypothetical protein
MASSRALDAIASSFAITIDYLSKASFFSEAAFC